MHRVAVLISLAFVIAVMMKAQVDTATILGAVTDPSGATIPNVKVTVRNQDTGFVRSVATSSDGNYWIPLVPIGPHYEVTAESPGFKAFVQTGIALQLNQNAQVDVHLQIGQIGRASCRERV